MNRKNNYIQNLDLLDTNFVRHYELDKNGNSYKIIYFNLFSLRLNLGITTPFVCVTDELKFQEDPFFNQLFSRTKPFFVIADRKNFKKNLPRFAVILDPIAIIQCGNQISQLTSYLIRRLNIQCSISVLSPYQTDSPVFANQFFGRNTEVEQIISHPDINYMIFGPRRSGKTSLLKQIEYLLKKKYSHIPNDRNSGLVLYLSCLDINSYEGFIELLLSRVLPDAYWRGSSYNKIYKHKKSLEVFRLNLFRSHAKKYNHGVTLLIDEVDSLIDSTEKQEIINFQRQLSANGYRFIQAGYRRVWNEIQEIDSGYWNFSQPLQLTHFSREESYEMIETPISNMDLKISNDLIQRIYEETGGIPNYIQFYCTSIIEIAGNKRRLNRSNFSKIYGKPAFDRIIMNSFHQNVREDLEKLICLWAANFKINKFSLNDIKNFFERVDVQTVSYDKIKESLNMLNTMGIIQEAGADRYRFVAPIVINQLGKRATQEQIDDLISKLQ